MEGISRDIACQRGCHDAIRVQRELSYSLLILAPLGLSLSEHIILLLQNTIIQILDIPNRYVYLGDNRIYGAVSNLIGRHCLFLMQIYI